MKTFLNRIVDNHQPGKSPVSDLPKWATKKGLAEILGKSESQTGRILRQINATKKFNDMTSPVNGNHGVKFYFVHVFLDACDYLQIPFRHSVDTAHFANENYFRDEI